MYLLFASIPGWPGHSWKQNELFFSNLIKTITVLDSYGITWNSKFLLHGSCICGNWTPLPGDSQLLCSWLYLLIRDGSPFIRNWAAHLVQKTTSLKLMIHFLTQKWMFTCHLVIAGPSHHRPNVEDETAFSCGNGVPVPQCSCLLQEPQPQHLTCHLQMSPSARPHHQGARGSTILPTHSHPGSSSRVQKLYLSYE